MNGTVSLSGVATIANYEAAIQSITYQNNSENPSPLTRTVNIEVSDDDDVSNQVSRNIEVSPENDAPVGSAIELTSLAYTENSGPSVITSTLVVSDVDDMNLERATIQVTGNYINGEDILSFADTATIIGNFDPVTGILTLSGTDSVANYQACLLYTSPSPRD